MKFAQMPSAKTQPARGMRDFLSDDVRKREYVIGVIKDVYERYGFEPLETPAAENIETLMGKYGEEGNQLIFKILKRGVHEGTGEADLALRYDLTVPLARVVAEYRDKLPKFFKRYQIQPVWRADRPARGRFREFYQCDVDVLGSRSMVVEAEICAAASEVLARLGFNDFNIRLNHRKVLTGILGVAGVALDLHDAALVALDKLDKIGRDGVEKELLGRGVEANAANRLLKFFTELTELDHAAEIAAGEDPETKQLALNRAVLGRIVEFVGDNEMGSRGVDELQAIVDYASSAGIGNRLLIDPSLARGLSYYTGAIMEIGVKDLAGSLGGGGRYDNLVGMFAGQDIPACGFSLGLERILVVMSEREMFPENIGGTQADVMVAVWDEESLGDSLRLAQELRAAGLRVDLYPEVDKLGKQFKYASSRAVSFVAVVGDEERSRGEVAIKDLRSGEQESIKRANVAQELRRKSSNDMNETLADDYLADAISSFRAYKKIADKAIAQVTDEELFVTLDEESNSIAVIMKHIAGNMISRWTDFLTSDGEKPDRNRDMEFVIESTTTRDDVIAYWEQGWKCVFDAIEPLTPDDFARRVTIRWQEHTIVQAINRQLTHYSYHIGQIVFLAKHFRSSEWQSLSIPRNRSAAFNKFLGESGDRTIDKEKQLDALEGFAKKSQ